MTPPGKPAVRTWLYRSMSASELRSVGTESELYMRRIPPNGSGRSCCSSGTLEEKMAWPELLCVVMTCDMLAALSLAGKRYRDIWKM